MTLAWRMYVWAGKPVGREYSTWLEGITGGGGVGEGEKPGPAIARVSSRLGEGNKTKADLSQQ